MVRSEENLPLVAVYTIDLRTHDQHNSKVTKVHQRQGCVTLTGVVG